MDSLNLKPQEEAFEVRPIGIRYRCEFCNEGEMIASPELKLVVEAVKIEGPVMIRHICSKCNKEMLLPKSYPYIEYIPIEKIQHIAYPKRYLIWPEYSSEAFLRVIMEKEIESDFFVKQFPQMTYEDNNNLFQKFEEIGLLRKYISNSFYQVSQWKYEDIPLDVIEMLNMNGVNMTDIYNVLRKRDEKYAV